MCKILAASTVTAGNDYKCTHFKMNSTATGTVPRGETAADRQCYTESPPGAFRVRTEGYARDGRKYQPQHAMFDLIGADAFQLDEALREPADREGSVLQRFRCNEDNRRFLVINFVCPVSPKDINFVIYFAEKPHDDPKWKRVVDRFLEGDDDTYRRHRLKMLPICAEGPWLVRKTLRPALIAKKLDTTFRRGPGFLEVTVDVGSSVVARQVQRLVGSSLQSLVLDLGFTIEGHDDSELPERLIGGCRMQHMDIGSFDFSVEA